MMEIRYLEQEEKKDTIPLWNEAFPEDKPPFLEYYYKEKTRDNRILTAWEWETGQKRLVSMLQRNPYKLKVGNRTVDSDYIVAVATAKDRRHRGLMRQLLIRMMEDMYREEMPFCYLMPADRRIYEPFGFVYIYRQEHWQLKQEAEEKLVSKKVSFGQEAAAGRWMDRWLEQRYPVFAVRDESYVKRLLLELESEEGWMELLLEEEKIAGIRCWWGTDQKEQRMLLCREEDRETIKEPSPAIMARITHLEKCLGMIGLKADASTEKLRIVLHVEDKLCSWNDGMFLWELDKEGSCIRRYELEKHRCKSESQQRELESLGCGSESQQRGPESLWCGSESQQRGLESLWCGPESQRCGAKSTDDTEMEYYELKITIGQLTQWIFGYQGLDEMIEGINEKNAINAINATKSRKTANEDRGLDDWWKQIAVWNGVFLDEIV